MRTEPDSMLSEGPSRESCETHAGFIPQHSPSLNVLNYYISNVDNGVFGGALQVIDQKPNTRTAELRP